MSEIDLVEEFNQLRNASRPYNWRAPTGVRMLIPSGPFRTAAQIRAAHTDSAGTIVSLASLDELAATEAYHGMRPGGAPY